MPDLKQLHALGFALHWLEPKSKKPVEARWTKGPRMSWEVFQAKKRNGYNVGVRLGEASRLPDGRYLAVIDCDMKSSDERHRVEMGAAIMAIPGASGPVVLSGRGNGSCHYYVATEKPCEGYQIAKSKDLVKVLMPSVKPSKKELAALTGDELSAGFRLRAAWEITVMGEGRQVVLPPSIHPDTGAEYKWNRGPFQASEIPTLGLVEREDTIIEWTAQNGESGNSVFKVAEVELLFSNVAHSEIDLIMRGGGCGGDRSASLYRAALALCKAGLTDDEVLTVLTDPDYYLGQVGYDHAKTKVRAVAAKWVRRFTLDKVRRETSVLDDFSAAVETRELTDDQALAQLKEIVVKSSDWRSELEKTEAGSVRATLRNVYLILANSVAPDVFRRNEFSATDVYGVGAVPWIDTTVGREVVDIDVTSIIHWLTRKWRIEPPEKRVIQSIQYIAHQNKFHPVREFFGELPAWDGRARVGTWLKDYLGAEAPEPYLSAVSRKVLCAMVARIFQPGCKFDQVLILEGPQGIGKSTAVRIISDPWFSDAHLNIADKDSVLAMKRVWVMEMGELSGMRKADVDTLKEFITRTEDRIRVPYGRITESFPRQCIFVGTTNNDEYLKDLTGNRRFWPVKVTKCDFKGLEAARNQLLAEARLIWEMGEPLYLEDEAAQKGAMEEQENRVFVDALVDHLGNFFENPDENFPKDKFTTMDLFSDFGPMAKYHATTIEQMRAASCLKVLGYEKKRVRIGKGSRKVFWEKTSNRG